MPPSPSTPRISKRPIFGGIFIATDRPGCGSRGYRLRLRRLDWKKHSEGRALTPFGMPFDTPAMLLDDLVRDRKPEPGALTDLLGSEERIEDLRYDVFRDAMAVVGDIHAHLTVRRHPGGNGNLAAVVVGGLCGIGDQIQENLIDLGG